MTTYARPYPSKVGFLYAKIARMRLSFIRNTPPVENGKAIVYNDYTIIIRADSLNLAAFFP